MVLEGLWESVLTVTSSVVVVPSPLPRCNHCYPSHPSHPSPTTQPLRWLAGAWVVSLMAMELNKRRPHQDQVFDGTCTRVSFIHKTQPGANTRISCVRACLCVCTPVRVGSLHEQDTADADDVRRLLSNKGDVSSSAASTATFRIGSFQYNQRVALMAIPALFVLFAFGGKPYVLTMIAKHE